MGGTPTQHPLRLEPHQRPISSAILHHHRNRRRGFSHRRFPIGSLVEVETDEEDFKGVYFLATVILSPSISKGRGSKKRSRKLYVEYNNLLVSEEGSERLKEYVDISFVRPAPPPQELCTGFEPHDVVDAFYKDGWWTGVVKRVVERGERFVVTFQYPPDELEFGVAELRVHWNWVNGSWFRPEKQSVADVMFDVGRKVEVSLDAEDCRDAWFPATIHEDLGNGAFLAEYSKTDTDNKAQRLKITVDSLHVRPNPPLLKEKNFVLLEKVDAYFNFGWWSGVITKELEGSKYIVFFKQIKKDKEFHQSELRPYLEWKDGKWFISSQLSQDSLILPSEDVVHEHHTPENSSVNTVAVPLNNIDNVKDTTDGSTPYLSNLKKDLSEKSTPVTHQPSQVTPSSSTQRRRRLSHSLDALLPPRKKRNEGNICRSSQQDTHDRSTNEMSPGSLIPVPVNNVTGSATQTVTGDQSDNHSWGKKVQRKQRKLAIARYNSEKVKSASSSIKKSSKQILQDKSPEADVGGKESNAVGNIAEDVEDVQNKLMKLETKPCVVIGLPCTEMGSPAFGKSRGKRGCHSKGKETIKLASDRRLQLHASSIQELKDSKLSETGEFSVKRKRGRPRKSLIEILPTPILGNAQNGVDLNRIDCDSQRTPEVGVVGTEALSLDKEKTGFSESQDKQAYSQSDRKKHQGNMLKRTLPNVHDGKVIKESVRLQQRHSTRRRQRRNTDSFDTSRGKTMETNYMGEVDTEAPCSEFDNEPLSKWIGGMYPPSIVAGSKISPLNNIEECTENNQELEEGLHAVENGNEKLPESGEQTPSSVDSASVGPNDRQNLPFVKNNILWKMIDSMEVFQRIPQRPHFKPLEHFKESSREGLAIGCMVTFSGVVDKVSALQFNDTKSITDDVLETLADLERHGFDISVVQGRVTKLLAVKDKQGKLVDDVNEINSQILVHNCEKSRIEEEINELNQQIQKLQEKLLLAESTREKKDGEIASLQAKLLETEESIKNVEKEFEGIAAATL